MFCMTNANLVFGKNKVFIVDDFSDLEPFGEEQNLYVVRFKDDGTEETKAYEWRNNAYHPFTFGRGSNDNPTNDNVSVVIVDTRYDLPIPTAANFSTLYVVLKDITAEYKTTMYIRVEDAYLLLAAFSAGGAVQEYTQVTKLGVVATAAAPKTYVIEIPRTLNFLRAPIEVLRFTRGNTGVVHSIITFDNGDESDFLPNDYVVFDGKMQLRTEFILDMQRDSTWSEEGVLHQKTINREKWLTIDGVNVNNDNSLSKFLVLHDGEYKKFEKYDYTSIKNPLEVNSLTNYFTFDEENGNVTDSKGTAVGTVYNAPTRVTGWNGKGKALSFNGTNQYVQFNGKIIPIGAKSIRFKVKTTSNADNEIIFTETAGSAHSGTQIALSNNKLAFLLGKGIVGNPIFLVLSNKTINDGNWHDILCSWDGTTNTNAVKVHIDDMTVPDSQGTASQAEVNSSTYNFIMAKGNVSSTPYYFSGQIDNIEIYNKVLTPEDLYNKNNQDGWSSISSVLPNRQLFLSNGMDLNSSWLNRDIAVLNPLSMTDKGDTLTESGKVFSIILDLKKYMDIRDLSTNATGQIKLCDAGDYENVVVYTAASDIYNNFNDLVEVLVFADESVTEVDLILEANWSPIDELEGDFEVVNRTDKPVEDIENTPPQLLVTAAPHPQLIMPTKDINISSIERFEKIKLNSVVSGRGILKVIFSFDSGNSWVTWDGTQFTQIHPLLADVLTNGISPTALEAMNMDAFNDLRSYYDTFRMAYAMKIQDTTDQAATDELSFQIEMKGTWKAAVHGRDYDYEYPDNSSVTITLYQSGDFKMNV